jgi:hypothetical protein
MATAVQQIFQRKALEVDPGGGNKRITESSESLVNAHDQNWRELAGLDVVSEARIIRGEEN